MAELLTDVHFLIHETFQSTLQGEGYWAGSLCDFIRLYGCPVGCPWCDTGYATGKPEGVAPQRRSFAELKAELKSKRVVISGGEPFANKNLPQLVDWLIKDGRYVHIETSGAFYQQIGGCAWVTLSPKQHLNVNYPVDPLMWDRCDEVKLVISDGSEVAYYRTWLEQQDLVYLQPEYFEIKKTLPLTLELIKRNPDFRLSLQTHKIIGVQ